MSRTLDDAPLVEIKFANDSGHTEADWVSKDPKG